MVLLQKAVAIPYDLSRSISGEPTFPNLYQQSFNRNQIVNNKGLTLTFFSLVVTITLALTFGFMVCCRQQDMSTYDRKRRTSKDLVLY